MLRFNYDRVVGYHGYRTHQPWDHGGMRLLHIDGVNVFDKAQREHIAVELSSLETQLIEDAKDAGFDRAQRDNHYGFTVLVEGNIEFDGRRDAYYQLRFSDGSLYVWLMPGPPEGVAKGLARSAVTDFTPMPPRDALEAQAFAEARAHAGLPPDPLAPAPWDEPLPNLPTQAAVDAHAEAAVDEAMARAYGQMEPDK